MRKRWIFGAVMVTAAAVVAGTRASSPAGAPSLATPDVKAPLHADSKEMEAGLVDLTLAYSREDIRAVRAGIDRLDAACRKLDDKDSVFPHDIVVQDMALHRVLDRGRAVLRDEGLVRFDEIAIWAVKSCGRCHAVARREGLLPPSPEASPAPSAPPGR